MASNRNNADSMHPAISWQGRVVNRVMGRAIKPVISRLRFTRRFMKFSQLGFDALTLALPVPANVHIARTHMGGIPGEWLIAGREVRSNRVVLYFHGGAYFFGSPRSHRAVTWRLSRHCRAKVLALDYRQPPACAVLISPWADLTCSGESHWRHVRHDPFIPMKALRFVSASYSEGYNPASPMLSPAFADLTGLPPLMIQVGSTEVLYSDAVRVAEQARKAGVPCQLQVWEDMMHVFHALAAWLPEASLALREIGSFVNEILREEDEAGHLRARTRVVSRRA